jgi:hypothetical protein
MSETRGGGALLPYGGSGPVGWDDTMHGGVK